MSQVDLRGDEPSRLASGQSQIEVPASLRMQLAQFRKYVWTSKIGEAIALGATGVLLAFLVVYVVDRFFDTPLIVRVGLFFGALALWVAVPRALHRWVWSNRRLDQLARLLRVREPAVGDQLLSVIELAEDTSEQQRSHTLCAAAIRQVADDATGRDFRGAAPPTWLRSLSWTLGISALVTAVLCALFPAAASNAWARFASPWRNTPRYTFTIVEPLPPSIVVPHGESVPFAFTLAETSPWRPETASLKVGQRPPIEASLLDSTYQVDLPAQVQTVQCAVSVGDFSQKLEIIPKQRPRLIGATADVTLPGYLQWEESVEMDVRGGRLAAVEGSTATIQAVASTPLKSATANGIPTRVADEVIYSSSISIMSGTPDATLAWTDFDNLDGQAPFELKFEPLPDAAPSVISQGLPRQEVVLATQQINFQALASDDFGVKRIGMSWHSLDESALADPVEGERILGAGDPHQSSMQIPATFCASELGIEPQPIEVVLWVEDYLPGRPREVSASHILYVLTAQQHAAWISNQLGKWQRAALDVRDKELQLHASNKDLRARFQEEGSTPELVDALRTQASLESANGRQLSALAKSGEGLLRQAARNSEIPVEYLDRWANILQTLNDIGSNRMPNVSELLKKASKETKATGSPSSKSENSPPMAGQVKDTATGSAADSPESDPDAPQQPIVPKVVDRESSMQNPEDAEPADSPTKPQKPSGSRQGLAGTTLTGPPPPPSEPAEEEPGEEEDELLPEALFEQEALLAEFEKVADELNDILANMEGSTLVKRLKAASREQNQVATKIAKRLTTTFGSQKIEEPDLELLGGLATAERESSQKISFIMDDMQAYYERRRMPEFSAVLEDMKQADVLDALVELADDIPQETGLSISQAEFWADNLDRWAEDLVPAAEGGGESQSPSQPSDSLPPAMILEVLRILEGEVNLRESTRVAEGARSAVEADIHAAESDRLAGTQAELRHRIDTVVSTLFEMPKGDERFGNEINLLGGVGGIMQEAVELLQRGETSSATIAIETEVIELLLKTQRINPKSGGGTGTSPGGGSTGTTEESALSLLGSGLNQNEQREARDVTQATGETGRVLPEEFRGGLDAYFNRLEESQN